ncbi:monovalent cation/H+ antiporter complex subunit F [Parvibaculum sp.]|jgi:multicomponent Na+:H+ antiporter subunit F|uniref:monovalent cation/H+ antiporter complex subunit F n=1 Tax=Parvibaculum sp. TaxID=2024848 RepID=UPI0025E48889|nr:monovalent cation/H+ antiporter complex subunit F [Parvibaculum sp.]
MMFATAAVALFSAMLLVIIRSFVGPTLYDRILAVNSFGTLTVLLLGLLGFLTARPDFLDIALLYALINFVGTIAVLKFIRYRALGSTSLSRGGRP